MSDGVRRSFATYLASLRHKHRPATRVSLAACYFPCLAHLASINHLLPDLISAGASDDLARAPVNKTRSLRMLLRIVYPIQVGRVL